MSIPNFKGLLTLKCGDSPKSPSFNSLISKFFNVFYLSIGLNYYNLAFLCLIFSSRVIASFILLLLSNYYFSQS